MGPLARSFALGLLTLLAAAANADERILTFGSNIQIHADGTMDVTETIRVRAEGSAIRRGIYRDFPTRYSDRLGNRYTVAFEVSGVSRDGMTEPYFTEQRSNGIRVYIGDANRLLTPGEYEYRLSYVTSHQIGFFPDHDELYWNVTGNGWDFPIDRIQARVTLPTNVGRNALSMSGFTGVSGSQETSIRSAIDSGASASIEAARALGPREGLTLVMTFPKGIVTEPSTLDRVARLLADNVGLLISLAGLVVVTLYFYAVWQRYGRDPDGGPIFPHYAPPANVSPAAIRHVVRMGYDNKAFTAAVISLAVKGHLVIEETGGKYVLRATTSGVAPPSSGERALLDALFADEASILLDKANHRRVRRAMAAHGKALKSENIRVYFETNSIFLVPAIAMTVGTGIAVLILGLFSVAVIAVLIVTILLVPLFAYLLKAPTRIGRRLLDQVEGFRLYLNVAEKDELDLRNPPTKTPELFEQFLPYALALGVEQRWAEKFDAVFSRLRDSSGAAYAPNWYHGHRGIQAFGQNAGSMAADLTGAVNSAIASASTPPGSSSGGGGGGSSGGGGGGGGGGGW